MTIHRHDCPVQIVIVLYHLTVKSDKCIALALLASQELYYPSTMQLMLKNKHNALSCKHVWNFLLQKLFYTAIKFLKLQNFPLFLRNALYRNFPSVTSLNVCCSYRAN